MASRGRKSCVDVNFSDGLTGIAGALFTLNFPEQIVRFVPRNPNDAEAEITRPDAVMMAPTLAVNGNIPGKVIVAMASTRKSRKGVIIMRHPLTVQPDAPPGDYPLTLLPELSSETSELIGPQTEVRGTLTVLPSTGPNRAIRCPE